MNDKRPISKKSSDWTDGKSENAFAGIAIFLIALGIIWFILTVKNEPRQSINTTSQSTKISEFTSASPTNPIKDYWAINGTLGDFTGGVLGTLFSLAGFMFLYLSFKKQTEANITQLNAYNHDKVEGRFFELIKLHRDNVSELQFTTYHMQEKVEDGKKTWKRVPTTYENRHFFVAILNQFKQAYKELSPAFDKRPEDQIYCADYFKHVSSNATLIERHINLTKYAKIDIIYLIVFFGLSEDGQTTIKSIIKNKYNENFVAGLLKQAALKPRVDSNYWHKWINIQKAENSAEVASEIIEARNGNCENTEEIYCMLRNDAGLYPVSAFYPDNYEKYYGGHQFRLGHYFRHIFHTISFINDNPELSPIDQYSYVKHLRGQFSTTEQILIFLNSISQLGRIWELEDKKAGGTIERWKQIMSDYMVIKNIPNDEILRDIKLSEFYPDIVYEGFDKV